MIMSIRLKDSTVSDFNIKEYIIRSFQAQVSVSQEMTAKNTGSCCPMISNRFLMQKFCLTIRVCVKFGALQTKMIYLLISTEKSGDFPF